MTLPPQEARTGVQERVSETMSEEAAYLVCQYRQATRKEAFVQSPQSLIDESDAEGALLRYIALKEKDSERLDAIEKAKASVSARVPKITEHHVEVMGWAVKRLEGLNRKGFVETGREIESLLRSLSGGSRVLVEREQIKQANNFLHELSIRPAAFADLYQIIRGWLTSPDRPEPK